MVVMDELELYQQMLSKDPSSQAFVYLAEAYFEREMYEKAIDTCINGLRLRPHDLRARVILGLSFLRTGVWDRAEPELLKAKEMLEINAVTYQALAEIYIRKGDPEQAEQYRKVFQSLHSEAPAEPETDGAVSKIELESVEPPQEDPDVATVTMAELYAQQGHLKKAAAVYRKILESAPGTVGVEDRLAKLEKEINYFENGPSVLSILESWRSVLQERVSSGTTEPSSKPVNLDSEKLADFLRKYVRPPPSS
jgi:tetratricopeptide (TPR) repeat protein